MKCLFMANCHSCCNLELEQIAAMLFPCVTTQRSGLRDSVTTLSVLSTSPGQWQAERMDNKINRYRGYRFSPEITSHAV
jgi:hypothetical protein